MRVIDPHRAIESALEVADLRQRGEVRIWLRFDVGGIPAGVGMDREATGLEQGRMLA